MSVGSDVLSIWRGEVVGRPEQTFVCFEGYTDGRDQRHEVHDGLTRLRLGNHRYRGIVIHGGQTIDVLKTKFTLDELCQLGLPIALATPEPDEKWDPVNLAKLPPGAVIVHRSEGKLAQFLQDPLRYVCQHSRLSTPLGSIPQRDVLRQLQDFAKANELQRALLARLPTLRPSDFWPERHRVFTAPCEGEAFAAPPRGTVELAVNTERFGTGAWLDPHNGWIVAYHGTNGEAAVIEGIFQNGLLIRGGRKSARVGARYGEGVYVSPDPSVALSYCDEPVALRQAGTDWYYHVFLRCQVNPAGFQKTLAERVSWLVPDAADVRVCGLLLLDSSQVRCQHGEWWTQCCIRKYQPLVRKRSRSRRSRSSSSRRSSSSSSRYRKHKKGRRVKRQRVRRKTSRASSFSS